MFGRFVIFLGGHIVAHFSLVFSMFFLNVCFWWGTLLQCALVGPPAEPDWDLRIHVRPFGDFLENRSLDFFETFHEVGLQ